MIDLQRCRYICGFFRRGVMSRQPSCNRNDQRGFRLTPPPSTFLLDSCALPLLRLCLQQEQSVWKRPVFLSSMCADLSGLESRRMDFVLKLDSFILTVQNEVIQAETPRGTARQHKHDGGRDELIGLAHAPRGDDTGHL